MAAAVDRTISSSMGNLSKKIKKIIRRVTSELREEMQELEIQKRIAETGRHYHMNEKNDLMHKNIKMKAQLDKCERMRKQLDAAKALARRTIDDKTELETELAQAESKIDALEAQLRVATEALERINKTKLRF
jgi:DNA repair exonuclease SbcCD ATPase subunit